MRGTIKKQRYVLQIFIEFVHLELREAFDLFDQDHSGTISLSELKQILVTLNLKATDTLVRKLMKEMDTDGRQERCSLSIIEVCFFFVSFEGNGSSKSFCLIAFL